MVAWIVAVLPLVGRVLMILLGHHVAGMENVMLFAVLVKAAAGRPQPQHRQYQFHQPHPQRLSISGQW